MGLEISRSTAGIFVSQTKYARDVLHHFGMAAAKPCATFIFLKTSFDTHKPCSPADIHAYRALVGALQYLTFSRLDIVLSVSKPSQFMHSPCLSHFSAAKWVLRFIAGTFSFGLFF